MPAARKGSGPAGPELSVRLDEASGRVEFTIKFTLPFGRAMDLMKELRRIQEQRPRQG